MTREWEVLLSYCIVACLGLCTIGAVSYGCQKFWSPAAPPSALSSSTRTPPTPGTRSCAGGRTRPSLPTRGPRNSSRSQTVTQQV